MPKQSLDVAIEKAARLSNYEVTMKELEAEIAPLFVELDDLAKPMDAASETFKTAKEAYEAKRLEMTPKMKALKNAFDKKIHGASWAKYCENELKRSVGDCNKLIRIANAPDPKEKKQELDAEAAKEQRERRMKAAKAAFHADAGKAWATFETGVSRFEFVLEKINASLDDFGDDFPYGGTVTISGDQLQAVWDRLEAIRKQIVVAKSALQAPIQAEFARKREAEPTQASEREPEPADAA